MLGKLECSENPEYSENLKFSENPDVYDKMDFKIIRNTSDNPEYSENPEYLDMEYPTIRNNPCSNPDRNKGQSRKKRLSGIRLTYHLSDSYKLQIHNSDLELSRLRFEAT